MPSEAAYLEPWVRSPSGATETQYLTLIGRHRLAIRIVEDRRGLMTDYCVSIEHRPAGGWLPVARADMAHGTPHIHRFDSSGREISMKVTGAPVATFHDVRASYSRDYDAVMDLAGRADGKGG